MECCGTAFGEEGSEPTFAASDAAVRFLANPVSRNALCAALRYAAAAVSQGIVRLKVTRPSADATANLAPCALAISDAM